MFSLFIHVRSYAVNRHCSESIMLHSSDFALLPLCIWYPVSDFINLRWLVMPDFTAPLLLLLTTLRASGRVLSTADFSLFPFFSITVLIWLRSETVCVRVTGQGQNTDACLHLFFHSFLRSFSRPTPVFAVWSFVPNTLVLSRCRFVSATCLLPSVRS